MYPKKMIPIVNNYYNSNNCTIREISKIFSISKSTIHRWINNKEKNGPDIKNSISSELICSTISNIILRDPFVTIKNVQQMVHKTINKKISISGIYIYFKKLKFSYKKVSFRSYSNIKNLNKQVKNFKKIVKKIKLNNIICLDESFIKTNMTFEHGWSKKGQKVEKYIKSNPKKLSIMMAISNKGIISNKIYETNVNKKIFYDYLKDDLLPKINNKYILMDNVSFHRSLDILELIKNSHNVPLFIPPYSPDFNPIENVFHILKHKIRTKNEAINIPNITKNINEISNKFQKMYKHSFRN